MQLHYLSHSNTNCTVERLSLGSTGGKKEVTPQVILWSLHVHLNKQQQKHHWSQNFLYKFPIVQQTLAIYTSIIYLSLVALYM